MASGDDDWESINIEKLRIHDSGNDRQPHPIPVNQKFMIRSYNQDPNQYYNQQGIPYDYSQQQVSVSIPTIEEPIDPSLLDALTKPKEKEITLRFEQIILKFVRSNDTSIDFEPGLNSYRRMLAYRIAQRFHLGHNTSEVVNENERGIVFFKTPQVCFPLILLANIQFNNGIPVHPYYARTTYGGAVPVMVTAPVMDPQMSPYGNNNTNSNSHTFSAKKVMVMKRHSNKPNEYSSKDNSQRRQTTPLVDKQKQYELAKARIFGENSNPDISGSIELTTSDDPSSSSLPLASQVGGDEQSEPTSLSGTSSSMISDDDRGNVNPSNVSEFNQAVINKLNEDQSTKRDLHESGKLDKSHQPSQNINKDDTSPRSNDIRSSRTSTSSEPLLEISDLDERVEDELHKEVHKLHHPPSSETSPHPDKVSTELHPSSSDMSGLMSHNGSSGISTPRQSHRNRINNTGSNSGSNTPRGSRNNINSSQRSNTSNRNHSPRNNNYSTDRPLPLSRDVSTDSFNGQDNNGYSHYSRSTSNNMIHSSTGSNKGSRSKKSIDVSSWKEKEIKYIQRDKDAERSDPDFTRRHYMTQQQQQQQQQPQMIPSPLIQQTYTQPYSQQLPVPQQQQQQQQQPHHANYHQSAPMPLNMMTIDNSQQQPVQMHPYIVSAHPMTQHTMQHTSNNTTPYQQTAVYADGSQQTMYTAVPMTPYVPVPPNTPYAAYPQAQQMTMSQGNQQWVAAPVPQNMNTMNSGGGYYTTAVPMMNVQPMYAAPQQTPTTQYVMANDYTQQQQHTQMTAYPQHTMNTYDSNINHSSSASLTPRSQVGYVQSQSTYSNSPTTSSKGTRKSNNNNHGNTSSGNIHNSQGSISGKNNNRPYNPPSTHGRN